MKNLTNTTPHTTAAVGLAVVGLLVLALAPTAWTAFRTSPESDVTPRGRAAEHQLAFEYTAIAEGTSVVYPSGQVGPVRAP